VMDKEQLKKPVVPVMGQVKECMMVQPVGFAVVQALINTIVAVKKERIVMLTFDDFFKAKEQYFASSLARTAKSKNQYVMAYYCAKEVKTKFPDLKLSIQLVVGTAWVDVSFTEKTAATVDEVIKFVFDLDDIVKFDYDNCRYDRANARYVLQTRNKIYFDIITRSICKMVQVGSVPKYEYRCNGGS